MKKIIGLCTLIAVSAILFFSCEELPCYDLNLVGTWMAPGGSTSYTFTETNSFEKVSKSISGFLETTTTYSGTWKTSGTNTLILDYKSSTASGKTRLYEFVAGIDELTSLEASDDAYTNALRWATDGNYTDDDRILLTGDAEDFSVFGWDGLYRFH